MGLFKITLVPTNAFVLDRGGYADPICSRRFFLVASPDRVSLVRLDFNCVFSKGYGGAAIIRAGGFTRGGAIDPYGEDPTRRRNRQRCPIYADTRDETSDRPRVRLDDASRTARVLSNSRESGIGFLDPVTDPVTSSSPRLSTASVNIAAVRS